MAPRNAIPARTTVFKPKRDHYSTRLLLRQYIKQTTGLGLGVYRVRAVPGL